MKSSEIRQLFLDFFKAKGHEVVISSGLLPQDDPTLLFTNAGMNQFKSVFLGDEQRPYSKAVSVQKCLRAGGKHNDLENVGRTARHHTFFEMLGNFSFGDYFKEDAIAWGWEFLTEWAKLPVDKLLVTVYEQDDEAAEIWKNKVGLSADKIFRLGEKDNFWQMGDTGPCGPCSEIHIDLGPETGCGKADCQVGCECDRYLEIWNLVFMQYNRDSSGTLTPLPKPSIDTGMGLERLSAIMQGKLNNFDSDLFTPVFAHLEGITGKKYGASPEINVSMRVIADHIRTAAFVLSEGLTPSNEGRGYVLRRIVRRAARHGFMLGLEKPFLYKILDLVYEMMSGAYPELLENTEMSRKVLQLEEERFAHTLASGMGLLDKVIAEVKGSGGKVIPGAELFKLYDTYGFPVDLAQDIAEDNELGIDHQGFQEEMELQKTRARASWVGGEDDGSGVYRDIKSRCGKTEFTGYETISTESRIVAILKDGELTETASAGDKVEVVLDRTPFYGESGGQVGDTGIIKSEGMKMEVMDTRKFHDMMLHIADVRTGQLKTGMVVSASVNTGRRDAIMRNHTATHLLQSALKNILGDHIKQAGSMVSQDRLRFDFTHFFAMNEKEIEEVETLVNEQVILNKPVNVHETDIDDAISKGVTALFGEKYGERVRVVRAGDFSAELCGGTHCRATGDIGPFKITSEGSVASGIRRVEAVTGFSAFEFLKEREQELKKAAGLLKVTELGVSDKIEKIVNDMKLQEKELERVKQKAVSGNLDSVLQDVQTVGDVQVLASTMDGLDMKSLRTLVDKIRDKMESGVIVLGSVLDGQGYYVSVVTKDLASRFHAGDILKVVTGGKGGGRPDMAQGGTRDTEGMSAAINAVVEMIKSKA
ncbi:MAG: alanine--tRNA ligase [Nitrospira sp.]|nr:alanine--tRNA ligase [bacterium]MBL7048364.1 alanine--tRNA ligase [Nitrospira sp.]